MWIIGAAAIAAIVILAKIYELLIGSRRPGYLGNNGPSQSDLKDQQPGLISFPPQSTAVRYPW